MIRHEREITALSNAVDKATDKIASDGVYVVKKYKDEYVIYEIIHKQQLQYCFPTADSAKIACTAINNKRKINGRRLQQLCKQYHKHAGDVKIFTHTVSTVHDLQRNITAQIRLETAQACLDYTANQLLTI